MQTTILADLSATPFWWGAPNQLYLKKIPLSNISSMNSLYVKTTLSVWNACTVTPHKLESLSYFMFYIKDTDTKK